MSLRDRLEYLAINGKGLAKLIPDLWKSGIIAPQLGIPTLVHSPGIFARYWLTTAREIEQAALVSPDRTALIDDDGALSYRDLQTQSKNFARYLHQLPVEEIRLGIMARNGRGIVTPLISKGYAGATLFLLNIGSSPEQLAGCIEENDINVLVIDSEFADRLPAAGSTAADGLHVVIAHEGGEETGDHPVLSEIVHRRTDVKLPRFPKHGNIVLMSSGTTGVPKGIARPEPKLPTVLTTILDAIPWEVGQNVQMTASIFHTWGWAMLNIAFALRSTVITRRIFDAEACLNDIQEHRCEVLISSPVFYKSMVALDNTWDYDASSLNVIASSGHALSPQVAADTIKRFGPILANIYGSTELTLASAATAQQIAEDATIGGAVANGTLLKILDDNGKELPRGEVGKVYLRNATTMVGYTNPKHKLDRVGMLQSIGDLGYIDSNGMLHVLGRADEMIIVGGENVYPSSVDNVLDTMPGIADHYSKGVDDDETFSRIAAWIVKDPDGPEISADDVREWVRTRLAEHSVPRDVHFVDELPRNATGKVIPRKLSA